MKYTKKKNEKKGYEERYSIIWPTEVKRCHSKSVFPSSQPRYFSFGVVDFQVVQRKFEFFQQVHHNFCHTTTPVVVWQNDVSLSRLKPEEKNYNLIFIPEWEGVIPWGLVTWPYKETTNNAICWITIIIPTTITHSPLLQYELCRAKSDTPYNTFGIRLNRFWVNV